MKDRKKGNSQKMDIYIPKKGKTDLHEGICLNTFNFQISLMGEAGQECQRAFFRKKHFENSPSLSSV